MIHQATVDEPKSGTQRVALLNKEDLLKGYKTMLLIRHLEQQLVDFYLKNKVMSFVHFYVGQEAVAAGVCNNLGPEDKVFGNHRSHGHYLAKGGNPLAMVAELLGRKNGCCHGKGGSMHMIDKSVNFMGSTPILGSVVPIATGSALASKLSKKSGVSVAFFGDGAAEEGVVYESINFAALFKLPLLLVLENNLYSVMSKLKDRRSENYSTPQIVTGLGAKYIKADGNDYLDVHAKTKEALSFISNGIPVVLECVVYRHMAHSAPIFDDKACYREIDVPEERERQCPIKKLKALLCTYPATAVELDALEASIIEFCKQVIEQAQNSPYPEAGEFLTDVYAQ
jgi:TPP-dependent pyruvate/acetoin dehydrogenase alpha subunit